MTDRKFPSWVRAFEDYTSNTESPALFRRWAGIATLAAVLEQKVWIMTSQKMHPNLYTFFVGPPGAGKSRIMSMSRGLIEQMPDMEKHIAPTSVNTSSLIDHLAEAKRIKMLVGQPALEYNSMLITVGEFGTFIRKYEDDMIAMLADLYDVTPYGERRRGGNLKVKIERPQLNMMIGVTPSVLMKTLPEGAWDQGFASRTIFVYGEDRELVDDFAEQVERPDADLVADLRQVNDLVGQFRVSEEYRRAVALWREQDEEPKPRHPRLTHYCSRRKAHLYRLSMLAAIDRGNALVIGKDEFNTAMGWLLEVEEHMPQVFRSPSDASDIRATEEIEHHIMEYNIESGKAMMEPRVIEFARQRLPAHAVLRVLELIIRTKKVNVTCDASGMRYYVFNPSSAAVAAIEEEQAKELRPLH